MMLTQDQINQIAKLNGGTWTDPQTGRVYMAQYGSTGGVEQGGTNFLENVIGSGSGNFTQGNMISAVDPNTGKESADYLNPKSTLWKDALEFVGPPLLGAAGGHFLSGATGAVPPTTGIDWGLPSLGSGLPAAEVGSVLDGVATTAASTAAPAATSLSSLPATSVNWGLPSLSTGLSATGVGSVLEGVPLTGGGSWMSTLANAVGGKDNLKLLTSLGGGLLAAGSDAPQSTRQSRMDPRLDPYVFGEQGVVPRASLLYDQRTNPTGQAMTDRAALRARAKGLLGI